mmetsp:Transcript_104201/g.145172  ORF Transcript_104201/g.145172 Transcript_104201/m.145172 type:complete len:221 (-) Transcript_104201:48-710(-)
MTDSLFSASSLLLRHNFLLSRFNKASKSISANTSTSQLSTNFNHMRGSHNSATSMHLHGLTDLICQAILRDLHLVSLAISSNAIQTSLLINKSGFLTILIKVHGRAKSSKRSQIVMKTAPVVRDITFLSGEVMQKSANDVISLLHDLGLLSLLIVGVQRFNVLVNVMAQQNTGVNDKLTKALQSRLKLRNGLRPIIDILHVRLLILVNWLLIIFLGTSIE